MVQTKQQVKNGTISLRTLVTQSFVEQVYGDANPTLEGYAFAGINMKDMKRVLNLLLDLREDGLLEGKDWIHF